MVNLYNDRTNELIGEISTQQLQFLIDTLEEESLEDKDYAITAMTLGYFVELGADPGLVSMLREELGDKNEIVIRWSVTQD